MNPQTPVPVRVVVADDLDDLRQLLRLSLERDGSFTVVAEAENGQAAVTAALAHRPDLVLLDITMPVMDGVHALKLIRSQVPSTTVVMLSSWDNASRVAAKCMALGAHGYIRKGEHIHQLPGELLAIVRRPHGQSPQ